MANCPEFLFFRQLAIQRLCMDKAHAEMFADALTNCGDEDDLAEGDTDEKVKVTSNDTNSSYLLNKVTGTGAIDLTQINDGGDESLGIGHSDTSSVSDIDTSGAQVIDTVTFDTYGHVTGFTLRNIDITDIFSGSFSVQDTESIDLTFSGGILSADAILSAQSGNTITILPDGLFSGDLDNLLSQDGGVVTWLQDYDFHVTPANYFLNGVPFSSGAADVTLSPSDPLLDRFDVIYVDSDQVVKVLEGVPSLNPLQPGLDLGLQIGLGVIFVQAGSTQPQGAAEECIYVDNTEWTAIPSDASIDVASTNTPCSGTVSIEGTTVTAGDSIRFLRGSSLAVTATFNVLGFLVRSKGSWGDGQLNIQWYNAGIAQGDVVVLEHGAYNFASDNLASCQVIAINISDFNVPISQLVDELRFTMSGSGSIGFFIDVACVQNNGSIIGTPDNDIHNQFFGPQTPASWWIRSHGRTDGWLTSPQRIGATETFYEGSEKFGWFSFAGETSVAFGWAASSDGSQSVAMGWDANAQSFGDVAVGRAAIADGNSVAIGWSASADGSQSVAVGAAAGAAASAATAVGWNAFSTDGGLALGWTARAEHLFSIALGARALTTGINQLVIGGAAQNEGINEVYLGHGVRKSDQAGADGLPGTLNVRMSGATGTDRTGGTWNWHASPGTGNAPVGTFNWYTPDATVSGTTLQTDTLKMSLNSNTKGLYLDNTRFQMDEGTDVVAANDLPLGTGNTFTITGNTQVNAIVNTNWQEGAVIHLHLTGTPTLKHNTAGGAGTTPMRLAGAVDFPVAGYTVLELELKDGFWNEVGRTVATGGGSGILTADNGLNLSTATNVQLGGPLLHDTTITNGAFFLMLTGSVAYPNSNLIVVNNGGGFAIDAISSGQLGVLSQTLTGASTSVSTGFAVGTSITGPGGNGVGTAIDMRATTTTLSTGDVGSTAIQLKARWTTAATASRTSDFFITGYDTASPTDFISLSPAANISYRRWEESYGSTVVAGLDVTFSNDGNTFPFSGTPQINTIVTTDWRAGSVIRIVFGASTLVKHLTAGTGAQIFLAGSTDFSAVTNDILSLVYDGTLWREVSRKLASSVGSVSANCGLIENPTDNIQLGSTSPTGAPLTRISYVHTGSFSIAFTNNGNLTGTVGSAILGGQDADITGDDSVVIGGANSVIDSNGAVSVGTDCTINTPANYAFVANDANTTDGIASAIFGFGNTNFVENGFVGGNNNFNGVVANANISTFIYGTSNQSIGSRSFIAGQSLTANGDNIIAFGKDYTIATANSFNVGFDSSIDFQITDDKVRINAARFQTYKGADVASGNDITVGNDGNVFVITGTNQINRIATADWQAGSVIYLVFNTSLSVMHNVASGGGFGAILLNDGLTLGTDSGTILGLLFNGTEWEEVSRKAEGGGSGFLTQITADNGLHTTSLSNVRLGGTLVENTDIATTSSFRLKVTGNNTSDLIGSLMAANTGNGTGLYVSTQGGANSAANAVALRTEGFFTSTSTVETVAHFMRTSTVGANGIGAAIDFRSDTTTLNGNNTGSLTSRYVSKWVDATTATRTGQVDFLVVGNAATNTVASIYGGGVVGIGISSSYTATRLNVVDNDVAGDEIVNITSTSTAATGNAQKGLAVSLSGTNANASQTTIGIHGNNTHGNGGGAQVNIGVRGDASGSGVNSLYGVYGTDGTAPGFITSSAGVAGSGTSVGVFGVSNSSTAGVWGHGSGASTGNGVMGTTESTNGVGVLGSSSARVGIKGVSEIGTPGIVQLNATDATPSTVRGMLGITVGTNSSGNVPGVGFGGSIPWTMATNNGGVTASRAAGTLYTRWTTVTDASRTSETIFDIVTDADQHDILKLSGTVSKLYSRDATANHTVERYAVPGAYKTLSEGAATAFVRVNVPSGTVTGGDIVITVEANDGVDYQARTLTFPWSAVNKAGTTTGNTGTPVESVAVSAGTLTVTIDTNDAGSGNLDIRANAASSLTETTLRCSYQIKKNFGTGTITPQ